MKKFLLLSVSSLLAATGFAQSTVNPTAMRKADMPPTGAKYNASVTWLYFGLDNQNQALDTTVAVGPVFHPITFSNSTKTSGATFNWLYEDTEGTDNTSTDKNLKVTYGLKPQAEGSQYYNNWYPFPTLTAVSDNTAEDSYTMPGLFQAGGGGDTQGVDYGLGIINPQVEGQQFYTQENLPIFGYAPGVDAYWHRYSFREDADILDPEFNYNHLISYCDFFYPDTSGAPLVVKGIRSLATGKVGADAVLTASIYFIGSGFVIDPEPDFSASITGSDIKTVAGAGSNGYDLLILDFKFDEPVVITKEEYPYFLVGISGFRDPENVEYFNPELSKVSAPSGLGMGWIESDLLYQGQAPEGPSWMPIANVTENEDLLAFYILLDASYPWLFADETEATVKPFESVTVTLNSSYPGDQLTVTGMPEWLTVVGSGRFEHTELTFTAGYHEEMEEVTLTVSNPIDSVEITLSLDTTGISDVDADNEAAPRNVYTIDGRRVAPEALAPGIYIVDGKKIVI